MRPDRRAGPGLSLVETSTAVNAKRAGEDRTPLAALLGGDVAVRRPPDGVHGAVHVAGRDRGGGEQPRGPPAPGGKDNNDDEEDAPAPVKGLEPFTIPSILTTAAGAAAPRRPPGCTFG